MGAVQKKEGMWSYLRPEIPREKRSPLEECDSLHDGELAFRAGPKRQLHEGGSIDSFVSFQVMLPHKEHREEDNANN